MSVQQHVHGIAMILLHVLLVMIAMIVLHHAVIAMIALHGMSVQLHVHGIAMIAQHVLLVMIVMSVRRVQHVLILIHAIALLRRSGHLKRSAIQSVHHAMIAAREANVLQRRAPQPSLIAQISLIPWLKSQRMAFARSLLLKK